MGERPAILEERQKTHGSFQVNAQIAQRIKSVYRDSPYYEDLSQIQKESLDFIASKIGRILSGNPWEPDHWLDISGYALLAHEEAKGFKNRGLTNDLVRKASEQKTA